MSSIFDRIFRYRQSEHKTPREDYFTETFVGVLNRCEPLRTAFVGWLIPIQPPNIKLARIETQRSFTVGRIRRRPDIWMEVFDADGKRHLAIIENKIDSGEGENQLSDYAKILARNEGVESRTLVYITKFSTEPQFLVRRGIRFRHLKWFQVYATLLKQQQDAEGIGELARELLQLMEDWNMGGTLSAAHLRATVISLGANVGNRLQEIQNEAWDCSGIGKCLEHRWMHRNWRYFPERGVQTSPPILDYEIRMWMGFRFDRRDADWDVGRLELPAPAVTVYRDDEDAKDAKEFPRPSDSWIDPVEGMSPPGLWVRQPVPGEVPRHGDALDEYYRDFFLAAFTELKSVFESGK